MASQLASTSHIFESTAAGVRPLKFTAKQYHLSEVKGAVLILAHCSGLHKETWEPFLCDFRDRQTELGGDVLVSEAWAFDCPSHGEAGILNEIELRDNPRGIKWMDYARVGLTLLQSDLIEDLDQRPLFLAGHSVGTY